MRLRTPPPGRTGVDRTGWPRGAWDQEPDRREWRYRSLACLMVRSPLGAWCGYVAVWKGHPWHGRGHGDLAGGIAVHGGVTYAAACHGDVCHAPAPGEAEDVWWVGFDCAHSGDVYPSRIAAIREITGHRGGTYRAARWVAAEVERLADQAQEAAEHLPTDTPPTGFSARRPTPRITRRG